MSSFITPVLPASPSSRRLAGIDVAQLLRDIGEASANTSQVELFRLRLDAQLLLSTIEQSGSTS